MKKLLIGILAVLLLVVGAIFVIPSLIDWNTYKAEIADRIGAATGRAVTLDGNIDLALLPRPTLSVAGARLANLPGASEPDMVRLRKLDVRVALMPLLRGRIQVQSVALIEPVIALEVLSDGRRNWDFAPTANAALPANRLAEAVQLDQLTIQNGTVIYGDSTTGIRERVESVDAQVVAGSLVGPFQIQGAVLARGVPLAVELTAGRMGEGGALPVRVSLRQPEAANSGTLRFAGIVITGTEFKLQGDLRAEGPDLRPAVTAILKAANDPSSSELPAVLRQSYNFRTAVNASMRAVELNGIEIQVGDTRGTGNFKYNPTSAGKTGAEQARPQGDSQGELTLSFNRFDLDGWLALAGGQAPAFRLPSVLQAKLTLGIDALSYRGNIVRQARLEAALDKGVMTLRRLSALLPGGGDVALTGTVASERGLPVLDVGMDANADNLRALLEWLGYAVDRVPADRLRKFSMTAQVTGRPDNIQFGGIDLRVDTSRVTGGVAYVDRGRPGFGARLEIDRLNLDAYAPDLTGFSDNGEPHVRPDGVPKPDLAGWLGGFDANLNADIATLTVAGVPVQQAKLDGTLTNGRLALRQFRTTDLAGIAGSIQGSLGKLQPLDDVELTVDLKAASLVQFQRTFPSLAGHRFGIPADRLGEATLQGRIAGDPERLAVDLTAGVAGGTVQAGGTLSDLGAIPGYDLKVRTIHPDAAKFAQVFAPDWRPAGKLGGVDLYGEISGSPSALSIAALQGMAGPVSIQGDATVDLEKERPVFDSRIQTGEIVIDHFLQTSSRATMVPSLIQPALAAEGLLWSDSPFRLDWMRGIDGRLALTSRAIAYGDHRLTDTAARARLENGELTVEQLDGGMVGGQVGFSGKLSVPADGVPALAAKLSMIGSDLELLRAKPASVDLPEGILDLDLDLTAQGASQAEMIGSLGGAGTVKVRDGAVAGFDLDRIASRLDSADTQKELNDLLTKSIAGGQTRIDRLTGSLRIEKGIFRTDDLTASAPSADITAAGSADLVNWVLDLALGIRLSAVADLPAFGLNLTGPLDRPQRALDAAAFTGKLEQRSSFDPGRRRAAEAAPLPPDSVIVPVQPAPAR
ncbi:uncharacterized protein involved in outer membrane biogenesis [Skermanella aerolata]|uniref:AsmA family protein n=1 Tax=Skermanella aerolata TaxID=393310 RepID=UPI003D1C0A81